MPATPATHSTDVLVIGWGLAGLVAAAEAVAAGRRVTIVDQEPRTNLGGQAWWSFGGLFFIDSPEQRRMGIKDSFELAHQDWVGTAGFDRDEDAWPRRWAEAYLQFAHEEKRSWLRQKGVGFFPVVGWAERGGYTATGPGNSVPRFHITWGTGPGIVAPFQAAVEEGEAQGLVTILARHRVSTLLSSDGAVTGAAGDILAPSGAARGTATSREIVGAFEISAAATIVSSGGIGGNQDLVRRQWPARLGAPPASMISGVPAYVDGAMLEITEQAGARLINGDRMWHYVEGIQNWDPVWPLHGIRILPGPSSVWLDATGQRLPVPLFPGFDTLGTLAHLRTTGYDHSWFVLSRQIIEKEFTLSGSEQNPDLTGRDVPLLVKSRLGKGAAGPVQAFMDHGVDFVVRDGLDELIAGMKALPGGEALDGERVRLEVEARDREIDNDFTKDAQIAMLRSARSYRGDRLVRTAHPHRILDPKAGPLVAVKLHILTRKSLGGIETDLDGRALGAGGEPIPGLYAAGEASGFGGGGVHGYRALEGTFLGGCLFSGRTAGRAAAAVRLGLGCCTGLAHGRHADSSGAAHDDVTPSQRNSRPRARCAHEGVFFADDEAQRESGEGHPQRESAQGFIGRSPDRRPNSAHRVFTGILRQRLRDGGDPPLRPGGEDGCRDAPRLGPSAARRGHTRPRRRERGLRQLQLLGAVVRAGELGCLDDEVADQLRVDRERPHREHGRRRVEQTSRRERRRGHRECAAGRGQAHRAVPDARRTAGEGEGVRCGGGIREDQALRHPP